MLNKRIPVALGDGKQCQRKTFAAFVCGAVLILACQAVEGLRIRVVRNLCGQLRQKTPERACSLGAFGKSVGRADATPSGGRQGERRRTRTPRT